MHLSQFVPYCVKQKTVSQTRKRQSGPHLAQVAFPGGLTIAICCLERELIHQRLCLVQSGDVDGATRG
eukprot:2204343-Prorocentrum_lima.AAC.1